ncbi:MAG: hypothetical protein HFE83_10850 [Lachnospiraceae bacterium]|jgi:tight adherence protein C|nr:hypothetical protein [Lachnospiraceae bacterium]
MRKRTAAKSAACLAAGILLYLMTRLFGASVPGPKAGRLRRNPVGGGELVYEFLVGGLEEKEVAVSLSVPEQRLVGAQFREAVPKAMEILCGRIVGENPSLLEIRQDMRLVREIPEFGLLVSWESDSPEIVSSQGLVDTEGLSSVGTEVILHARLSNDLCEEVIEIPVRVLPGIVSSGERFQAALETLAGRDPEAGEIALPVEFEGKRLTYQSREKSGDLFLLFLGAVAAVCLPLKEKADREKEKKRREERFLHGYPDLVSRFLILTGAGYPVKQAWKKQVFDYQKTRGRFVNPVYEEMELTLNQMETGTPEARAYGEFGRRVGLRPYVKFVSLLQSSLQVGGKNLRTLLEAEMEEALKQRRDLARRKGEEASTKLLLPMFLMLGIVMVLVVAPAFLTLA